MTEGLPPGFDVSRETRARLGVFVSELLRWQASVNLISPNSIPHIWRRHVADSLQLQNLAPDARKWLDMGSGAGLPGIVIAATDPRPHVILAESDARKCAFLRHVVHVLELDAEIIEGRVEHLTLDATPDIITARGLAPLTKLFDYAQHHLAFGATGLFPKGKSFATELTEARECWTFDVDVVASRTDPDARILRVTDLQARSAEGKIK